MLCMCVPTDCNAWYSSTYWTLAEVAKVCIIAVALYTAARAAAIAVHVSLEAGREGGGNQHRCSTHHSPGGPVGRPPPVGGTRSSLAPPLRLARCRHCLAELAHTHTARHSTCHDLHRQVTITPYYSPRFSAKNCIIGKGTLETPLV